MTAAKETVGALRRHAATWVEGSIPHKLLTMVADVLQDFCDQDPDWHLQLADHPDNVHDRNAALCMCGHPRADHVNRDGACLAYIGGCKERGECACRVFGLQDPPMQKQPDLIDTCTCGHSRRAHLDLGKGPCSFITKGIPCGCAGFDSASGDPTPGADDTGRTT